MNNISDGAALNSAAPDVARHDPVAEAAMSLVARVLGDLLQASATIDERWSSLADDRDEAASRGNSEGLVVADAVLMSLRDLDGSLGWARSQLVGYLDHVARISGVIVPDWRDLDGDR